MPVYRIIAVCCLIVCATSSVAVAQFEDEFATGVVADYVASDGTKFRRIDPQIAFKFGAASPDPRLGAGKFSVHWDGLLLTKTPGPYTLHVYAQGKVRIQIEDEIVLEAESKSPGWLTADPIDLKFDWHPFQVEFEKTSPDAQITLYWAGPDYSLEPITPEWLFHEIDDTFAEPFNVGRDLARAHRCNACHGGDRADELPAPALDRLAGHVSQDWIVDRLTSAANKDDASTRKMPHYDLPPQDAAAIAAFLFAESDEVKVKRAKERKGSVKTGKLLFQSLGCFACHRVGDVGAAGPFSGGDLSDIAAKRPPHFFSKWLEDPAALNVDHRMPTFQLDADSRNHLAAYLSSLNVSGQLASTAQAEPNDAQIKRGRELALANRCDACHRLPGDLKEKSRKPLASLSSGDLQLDACLAEPDAGKRPGYALNAESQEAIRTYFRDQALPKTPAAKLSGAQLIRERNCLSCHARGIGKGLAPTVALAAADDPALSAVLPTLTPPSLNSVGDKLHDAALIDVILRKDPVHRPWLKVQMPRFPLDKAELEAIKDYLVEQDRIPAHPLVGRPSEVDPAALSVAGERLVGGEGFNCTSCHAVGDWQPSDAPLNAKGPTLSMLGERIRRDWFDRWVRKPARIVPQMEMPSVTVPVSGVLHDEIDDQLAAVWKALNTPGFQPPKPNPVRVARRSGVAESQETALILTDVLRDVDHDLQFIKPLLIGLPNRHNMLFDLETGRIASWTLGDAARERSEGKKWFWELAGAELFAWGDTESELVL
ncbi:MAG: c-type cytochrome, partial [Blastopirellula sp. JB062]